MSIYRIDLTGPQGESRGSVSDVIGTCLIRSYSDARRAAIRAAAAPDTFAHLIRISGAGSVKCVGIVPPGSTSVGRI